MEIWQLALLILAITLALGLIFYIGLIVGGIVYVCRFWKEIFLGEKNGQK